MNAAIWLVAVASLGIDVGWQPVDEGGYELFLQIEPEQLESLRAGEPLTSDLPVFPERIVRVHWMVGSDQLPQTTRPAAAPAATSTPGATTAKRPIEPKVPGELSLTDGRTATHLGTTDAVTTPSDSTSADLAAQQPTLSGSPEAPATAASTSSDDWHSATPNSPEESALTGDLAAQPPASSVLLRPQAGSFAAPLDRVGPVDPSETNVDLSDGVEVSPAPGEFGYEVEPASAAVETSSTTHAAPAEDEVTAASTTTPSVAQHRARPESPPPTTPHSAADTATAEGNSQSDDSKRQLTGAAVVAPRPLTWLAALATLGASLAANVFFLWGFVDAKRRYRLALSGHGLRDSALQPT
jgi:hypothetical protein